MTRKNPTVTVEAACSKHRRLDVLPLHPELAVMLKVWLKGVESDAPVFPKLAKRRTWLMVRKDLERIGIAYKNEEGIADFHAAGRHTCITELLRSGASLVETKELARHSDVRMTMRYAHIGLDDQAKAVARISWECPGSKSGGKVGHLESSDDNDDEKTNPKRTQKASVKVDKRQKRHHLTTMVPSGGGGDRTRVPRYFSASEMDVSHPWTHSRLQSQIVYICPDFNFRILQTNFR